MSWKFLTKFLHSKQSSRIIFTPLSLKSEAYTHMQTEITQQQIPLKNILTLHQLETYI